jgi:hypothetical protein
MLYFDELGWRICSCKPMRVLISAMRGTSVVAANLITRLQMRAARLTTCASEREALSGDFVKGPASNDLPLSSVRRSRAA